MKKALITGIAGFAGSHLADYLLSQNLKVYGFFHPDHSASNIDHIKRRLTLHALNNLNKKLVEQKVSEIKPDYVFHLAAFSSPVASFSSSEKTLQNNLFGQIYLLDALAKIKSKAKILIIGSADEYKVDGTGSAPINESTPLLPLSPYAVSKVAQDLIGYVYFRHSDLNVVRVRPFNHIGPRQSPSFVVSAFASQIVSFEKSKGGTIEVGNLDAWRDFTDVRDMVRAYYLALSRCKIGDVYNIGSGKPCKISNILEILLSFTKAKINVKVTKERIHDKDIKKLHCDATKFRKQTGWRPEIPLAKTLSDTIEYERRILANNN